MIGLKYVSFLEDTGYGQSARAYLRGLIRARVPVTWQPLMAGPNGYEPFMGDRTGDAELDSILRKELPYDTVVVHTIAEYYRQWRRREAGKRVVGYTTWESTDLPTSWTEALNGMDLLMVPSRWNARVFRSAGVKVPIELVPHVWEAPLSGASPLDDVPPDTLVFYSVGPWTHRKAHWRTLEAYWRAFSADDPVLLVIKADGPDWTRYIAGSMWKLIGRRMYTSRRALLNLQRRHPSRGRVRLIRERLSESSMHGLHTRGDCYVSLCSAEGWGLGAFDAAGRGKPVVITGFGGQLDYLPASDAYLVDYRLESLTSSDGEGRGSWAVPNVDHAARLMREVFEDRVAARVRGERLGRYVSENFNERVITQRMLAALTVPGVA